MSLLQLQNPLNTAMSALSFFVVLCNLLMVGSLISPLVQGNQTGRFLKVSLIFLNVGSCALQVIVFSSIYGLGADTPAPAYLGVPSLAAFLFGGELWLQLELRFIFNALFSSGPVGGTYWTSKRKFCARIILIVAHLLLLWPAYLIFFGAAWIEYWMLIGQATHGLLIAITSFLQAYLITSRLIHGYKTECGVNPLHFRHVVLVVLLVVTLIMNIAGIVAYTWGSSLPQTSDDSNRVLSLLTEQFASTCLGIDVFCVTVSLLMMVSLVMARQAAINPTKQFKRPMFESHLTSASSSSHSDIKVSSHSDMKVSSHSDMKAPSPSSSRYINNPCSYQC
ncbi:hypothetical protein BASA61_004274 [Batrachochytrium salamandrivorans]|nr:hypothetical protein BASA61_004274 [Batrachochytrium salamandrivorans]